MLYIMLGTIIFLLTFCAFGVTYRQEDKGLAVLMSWIFAPLIIGILGAVYYFFFR